MKSIRATRNLVPRLQLGCEISRNRYAHAKTLSTLNTYEASGLGSGRIINLRSPLRSLQVLKVNKVNIAIPASARSLASKAYDSSRKDVSVLDTMDDLTYNISKKPVSFMEGASYSVLIFAGFLIAAASGYAFFKERIFGGNEYKVFGKSLERIQNDSQVRVRIGSRITGYGEESRSRSARQQISNTMYR